MLQLSTGLDRHRAVSTYPQRSGTASQYCAPFHWLNCPERQDLFEKANHTNPALLLLDWSWVASSLLGAWEGQLWCVSTCLCYLRACLLQNSCTKSRKNCCQHSPDTSSIVLLLYTPGLTKISLREFKIIFTFYLKSHTHTRKIL